MLVGKDVGSVGFSLRGLDFRQAATARRLKPTLRDHDTWFSMRQRRSGSNREHNGSGSAPTRRESKYRDIYISR